MTKGHQPGAEHPADGLIFRIFWIQKVSGGAGNAHANENADVNKIQHGSFGSISQYTRTVIENAKGLCSTTGSKLS